LMVIKPAMKNQPLLMVNGYWLPSGKLAVGPWK
jgi:hypothetical protein